MSTRVIFGDAEDAPLRQELQFGSSSITPPHSDRG